MTVENTLKQATQALGAVGIKTAQLDALVLLEYVTDVKREWLLAHGNRSISKNTQTKFNAFIKQRQQRVPVAYLTKKQEFYGLTLKVTPAVLIPRPETEQMVELALQAGGSKRSLEFLDVGTGSGAIAVVIAKERPHWQVVATDISDEALRVARTNAKMHKASVRFIKNNLLHSAALQAKKFDIITANLPYVSAGAMVSPEAKAEPKLALFAGKDGLDLYRQFFAQVMSCLKSGGKVIIEAEPNQHKAIIKLASSVGLSLARRSGFALAFQA